MGEIFHGRASSSSQLAHHLLGAILIGSSLGLTGYTLFGHSLHTELLRDVGFGLAAALAAAGLFYVVRAMIRVAAVNYRIDDTRVEVERGLVRRKVDNLDLWRVKDIRFRQGVFQRMLGLGDVELDSTDVSDETLVLRGLPDGRRIYDQLRDSIDAARKARGVVALDGATLSRT